MGAAQSAGKKFGRGRERSKANARYNAVRRDLINKARKVAKHAKSVKAAAAKAVKRGLARAKRRGNKCAILDNL